jgi:hypothetical protein
MTTTTSTSGKFLPIWCFLNVVASLILQQIFAHEKKEAFVNLVHLLILPFL